MKRGEAGSLALRQSAQEKVKHNKKILKRALSKLKEDKMPLIKSELVKESGLSIATLNRSPYKEMIAEYLEEEKIIISPHAKYEMLALLNENRRLKEENAQLVEKYKRLKKEIANYSYLFE